MRIKLHKRNVALLDFVKFTGYCSLIDNSSAEESVVRAELSVPMIVLSSSDGHNAVHTSVSYINIGKGRIENELEKSSARISLASMGRDEPVDKLDITGSTDNAIYKKLAQFIESQPRRAKMNAFSKTKVNLSAAHELQGEKEDDSGISSCSKQPSKRSISAKKIKRDFCFSVINLCILHQYLKKTGTPSFFFFLFLLVR